MMHHRVYKLTHGVSLLGLRPQDFVVILFSVIIGLNVLGALFPGYLRLVVAAAFIFLTFKVWQSLRDRLPEHYFSHLFRWLSEPEVYRPSPDLRAIPLIVDPKAARANKPRQPQPPLSVREAIEGGANAHLA